MLSYNSLKGLRLYHWLPLVLWAFFFFFPIVYYLSPFLANIFVNFILDMPWTLVLWAFPPLYFLMQFSVKNFFDFIINFLNFWFGVGCYLCINLTSLHFH